MSQRHPFPYLRVFALGLVFQGWVMGWFLVFRGLCCCFLAESPACPLCTCVVHQTGWVTLYALLNSPHRMTQGGGEENTALFLYKYTVPV